MFDLNYKIDPEVLKIVGTIWMLVFLITLALLLLRKDLEAIPKFMWVFVVCVVPFFGVFLYWFLAPKTRRDESATVIVPEQRRE